VHILLYIPTHNEEKFLLFHIVTIQFGVLNILKFGYSNRCVLAPHHCFNLHSFPENTYNVSFPFMYSCLLCNFFGCCIHQCLCSIYNHAAFLSYLGIICIFQKYFFIMSFVNTVYHSVACLFISLKATF
jgi:hypothetical protein